MKKCLIYLNAAFKQTISTCNLALLLITILFSFNSNVYAAKKVFDKPKHIIAMPLPAKSAREALAEKLKANARLFSDPAVNANVTFSCVTASKILVTGSNGTASYTFSSATDCDGIGFTAFADEASAGSATIAVITNATVGPYLRFQRVGSTTNFSDGGLKSASGAAFKLTGIEIIPVTAGVNQTLTITAYKSGTAIPGSTVSVSYVGGTIHGSTLTSTDFGANYNNIDEILVTTTQITGVGIKNITTTAPVLPGVATLANLAIGSGTLSPAFATGTTAYTASVPNATNSITVTPTLTDALATVTVGGVAATSGSASTVNLSVGSNTIPVKVTAQDGTTTDTYNIVVTRAQSSDASLSALSLSTGTLSPTFASGTLSYTASVANSVGTITVTPTTNVNTASVKVNGTTVTSGSASGNITLTVGNTTIPVVVTAQDGTVANYSIVVTRAQSSDASLSALSLSTGTLSPTFASGTLSYTASVANSVGTITVTPTTNVNTASVKVNGTTVTSGTASGNITLAVGNTTIPVVVTAQDGTVANYSVVVTRAQSSDASLSALSLSTGTLSPTFAGGTLSYTASVANSVSSITVTPTTNVNTASVKVNGTTVTSGTASGSITLTVGNTTIPVLVTAQDGTVANYSVVVTRAPSTDATLSSLTVDAGTLSPVFASGTLSYNLTVPNATTTLNVTPTVNDATATVTINGNPATSGAATGVTLLAGPNTIPIAVTAQDGSTVDNYVIHVIGTGSMNASLKTIALSTGSGLTRITGPADVNYKTSVDAGTASLTITPTAEDANAVITVNGSPVTSGTASGTITLTANPTIVNIQSTAQDGTDAHSYTLSIYLNGSSNASLLKLAINSGTPLTLSNNTTYTTSVPLNLNSVILSPTAQDAGATISVGGHPVTSGTGSPAIALNSMGQTSINILVTAADGVTTNTYTVLVNKVASSNASLATLSLSSGSSLTATGATTYTASVVAGTPSLTITSTTQDAGATIMVNGSPVASGTASPLITLNNGAATTITVQVTAANGTTVNNYVVTVNMLGSSNASLANLALSTGSTLTTTTGPANVNYNASVTNGTASLTITPTAQDPNANILVNGTQVNSGSVSAAMALNVGASTTINIQVTAQDGTTIRTYQINVNQTGSSNATLKTLSLSTGALTLIPGPGAGNANYTAQVANNITTTTVRPTAADATASINVNGSVVASGNSSNPITLNTGSNTITVTVTAQDGTVRNYVITVTRDAPPVDITTYAVNQDLNSIQNQAVVVHPAVSPNGDGINDFLLIEGINSRPDNKITIINRNGGVVYQAAGYDNSSKMFDGHSSVNGSLQQPGTYLYVLDYTEAGVSKHLTGYIILKY